MTGDDFDAQMWEMFGDGREREQTTARERWQRDLAKRQRDNERIAMRHKCPVCGASEGEVCTPQPVYLSTDSFTPAQRVHETRYCP